MIWRRFAPCLLLRERPKQGLSGLVVCLAMESGKDDITELVCGGSEPGVAWGAAKALFKKRDVPGLVKLCDLSDGPAIVNNLLR